MVKSRRVAQVNGDSKPWYMSITMWGGLIALLSPVLGRVLHAEIDPDTQTDLASIIVAIASAIGGLVAIWGRLRKQDQPKRLTFRRNVARRH